MSFGTTPPQFPIRGHFWWDGATLHMWDGVQWETIGPSGVVGEAPLDGQVYGRQNAAWVTVPTSTIVFAMAQPNALTVTANTWVQIPYNSTPLVDLYSGWDPATFRYVSKKPGLYLFECREYGTATTGQIAFELVKNDSGTHTSGMLVGLQAVVDASATAVGAFLSFSGVTQMNGTTDFVRMWGYSGAGSIRGALNDSVFTIVKLA